MGVDVLGCAYAAVGGDSVDATTLDNIAIIMTVTKKTNLSGKRGSRLPCMMANIRFKVEMLAIWETVLYRV